MEYSKLRKGVYLNFARIWHYLRIWCCRLSSQENSIIVEGCIRCCHTSWLWDFINLIFFLGKKNILYVIFIAITRHVPMLLLVSNEETRKKEINNSNANSHSWRKSGTFVNVRLCPFHWWAMSMKTNVIKYYFEEGQYDNIQGRHVFEPFQLGEGGPSVSPSGTGL